MFEFWPIQSTCWFLLIQNYHSAPPSPPMSNFAIDFPSDFRMQKKRHSMVSTSSLIDPEMVCLQRMSFIHQKSGGTQNFRGDPVLFFFTVPLLRMKKKRSHSRTQWLTLLKFSDPPFLVGPVECVRMRCPTRTHTQWIPKTTCFGWGAAFRWMLFDWLPHMVVDCHCVNPPPQKKKNGANKLNMNES